MRHLVTTQTPQEYPVKIPQLPQKNWGRELSGKLLSRAFYKNVPIVLFFISLSLWGMDGGMHFCSFLMKAASIKQGLGTCAF